jgi:Scaffold domain
LIETLRASRLKGLNPGDYDAETLAAKSRSLKGASTLDQASFEATLTQSTMEYISDLRIGRINPKHLKVDIDVQAKKYDLPEFIARQVVGAGNIQSVLDQIEPPYAGYRRIENTLKQYLDLAAKGEGAKVPAGTRTIAPGDTYAGAVMTFYYPSGSSNPANSVQLGYESPTPWGPWTLIATNTFTGTGYYSPITLQSSALAATFGSTTMTLMS